MGKSVIMKLNCRNFLSYLKKIKKGSNFGKKVDFQYIKKGKNTILEALNSKGIN